MRAVQQNCEPGKLGSSFDQKLYSFMKGLFWLTFGVHMALLLLTYMPAHFDHPIAYTRSDDYIGLLFLSGIAALVCFASLVGIGSGMLLIQWCEQHLCSSKLFKPGDQVRPVSTLTTEPL